MLQDKNLLKEGEHVTLVQSGAQPIWRVESTHHIQVRKVQGWFCSSEEAFTSVDISLEQLISNKFENHNVGYLLGIQCIRIISLI